ncbi:TIR domain-containing protein [Tenacibaculum finnmarkense]|uniref:TIR domain-containing protein n=1 Tax=Tenacibaculum finnmarkense TaxID=2781243 RepID=UPI001EFABBAA|nr:TIR domain-containing protein [Tenacibaculum finnmarkense]MCG8806487.1 TIR domain-containing protein [Tenacibaculum finnmarkense]MCG8857613.1 TIR domain-containing protein [Tenacibaculum finnmarkense]
MEKWATYLVSKVKWNNNQIESFYVHEDLGDTVGSASEKDRNWIVQQLQYSRSFCCIHKTKKGLWSKGKPISLENGRLKWNDSIPLILTKRKTFISYYHNDDQYYKDELKNIASDLIVSKSVEDGDINSEVSTEYIKQLIQKGFLSDTTVLIVLIGNKTKCRKHVDWEISGALNYKVGNNYSGILGLILPNHPDFGTTKATHSLMPARLDDNFKSNYAIIRDYTTDRVKLQNYIEEAFKNRTSKATDRINSRIQLQRNTCS